MIRRLSGSRLTLQTFMVFILGYLLCAESHASQPTKLQVVFQPAQSKKDPRDEYFLSVLRLALSETVSDYGEYSLSVFPESIPPGRIPLFVRNKQYINVFTSPVTEQLNDTMLAVPFPLLRGIQGMRVSFIHSEDPDILREASVNNSLKQIIFNQGQGWVDELVFKDAGLQVVSNVLYESLFGMINSQRVHAFPRGVNEIMHERDTFAEQFPNLHIDQHLLIYYPLPVFFYVVRDDNNLATRILTGLRRGLEAGRFSTLFEKYHGDALQQLNLTQRQIFRLANQYLPPGTEQIIYPYLHPIIKQHIIGQSPSQTDEQNLPTAEAIH